MTPEVSYLLTLVSSLPSYLSSLQPEVYTEGGYLGINLLLVLLEELKNSLLTSPTCLKEINPTILQ